MSRRTHSRRRALVKPTLRERARLFLPLRSWRVQLLGAALAVAAAIISAQSFASAREAPGTYLIQPGDSLLGIAQTTGVGLDQLVSLNAISNPDFIVAGDSLSLNVNAQAPVHGPVLNAAADASAARQYTVKSGDTLWDIAQANGVSVDSIVQLNTLANVDQLSVGQALRLPTAGVTLHAASTTAPKSKATPAVQPKPTPTAAPAPSPLQQRLAAEVSRVAGANVHVGAAAYNLTTGERINLHADDAFPSASVMKLPILVELERQTTAGTLPWTDSLRAEASAMIAVSDNTAANQIAEAIHPQSVNDTMAHLGLGGTHFVNLFTDTRGPSSPGQNVTTPSNMARLLELVATDQIVSPQVSADMRNLLARNVDRSKLVRSLPADAHVAHKSGWYDGVANDVGIVSVDRVPARWTIAVFTENLPDAETGNQIIAAVSKLVYDAWSN